MLNDNTTPLDVLNTRIQVLKDMLHELYQQRRGRMDGDTEQGWCSCCGKNRVYPCDGEDTCYDCMGGM